jgi:hypothetical protein
MTPSKIFVYVIVEMGIDNHATVVEVCFSKTKAENILKWLEEHNTEYVFNMTKHEVI